MADTERIVVIGGSAAGSKAAARARRLDQHADVVILQKDKELSMAACGYPYYVEGCFNDRNMLLSTPTGVVRDPGFYLNVKAIEARNQTEVTSIDTKGHKVNCRSLATGETGVMEYDRLIIATGATPRTPPVPGMGLKGITTLHSLSDADFLRRVRDEGSIRKAVIVGGGLIGVETCEALHLAGIETTVVELLPQLLAFLDWETAKLVENHIRSKGVNVVTANGIAEFLGEDGRLVGVRLNSGEKLPCELAVVAIGVIPNVKLAKDAGLSIGPTGGIVVNEYMQTSDADIYACGDCVEIPHRITGRKVHAPLGDLANLEGRVAGENAVIGNTVTFPGTVRTGICRVFDYTAGSTGLCEAEAARDGYDDIASVICAGPDRPHFMNGQLVITKLVAERSTGRVLGAQCVGPGNVAKQIAQWAIAVQAGMHVEDVVNADLPYAPPFSQAIDHFITTAHIMQNKLKGRLKGISPVEVRKMLDNSKAPFLVDVRGPDEYEQMRLGIGETLIPLGALRKRLNELPKDKDREIVCYCMVSLRGYEAALVIEANGWKNVKVMEGGIAAWPYAREK